MADNYVSISIRAQDGAKPELDELKAKLDELGAKVAEARADVDDAGADAKLAALEAKLEAAGKMVARPKIDLAGAARALAQVTAVDAALEQMEADAEAARTAQVTQAKADLDEVDAAAKKSSADQAAAAEEAAAREAAAAEEAADAEDQALRREEIGVAQLKAQVDELGDTVALATVKVKDDDARLRLMGILEELDELSAKVARPDVDVRGILKAKAELADLKAQVDKEDAESDGEGILGRFFNGSNGRGGVSSGFAGVLGKLPLIGEQLGGIAEKLGEGGSEAGEGGGMVSALGSVSGSAAGLVVVGGVVGAVVTEVAALATGLTAAGLGIGSFAALAYPAFKQVFGALSDTKAELAKLPAPVQTAVSSVKQLENGFDKMSKAFQPTAFKVLNQGLGIANQLLPYLGKFADAAAPSIERLLGTFSKGLDSGSFKHFMDFLQSLSGPVIGAIGSGMSGLGKDVMQLMESFSKKDVLNAVNIAFRLMGFALSTVTYIAVESMQAWDNLIISLHKTAVAFDVARHAAAALGHDTANDFDTVRHAAASFAHGTASDFDTVRHAIAALAHDFANDFDTIRHSVATGAHDVSSSFDTVRHSAAELAHDVAAHFDEIRHDAAQWAGDLVTDGGRVISFFEGLPGRIAGALSSLGGMMFQAGAHAISMLISGLESMVGGVIGAMSNIAGEIADHLPHSPAKKGPLSGGGSPDVAGRKVGQMLTQGLRSSVSGVSGAMTDVTRAIQVRPGAAGSLGLAGGAGGTLHIQLSLSGGGSDGLLTWLRHEIRVKGAGNVQKALGTGKA